MVITISLIAYCLFLYLEYRAAFAYRNSFRADFEEFENQEKPKNIEETHAEWPDNPTENNIF